MKVLFIHQSFVSPNESGGTRHYEIAKYFIAMGHQFTIIGSNLNYHTGDKVRIDKPDDVNEPEILQAYALPKMHKSFIWRVLGFLCFMITAIYTGLRVSKPDVVIGTTPQLFQTISAWVIAKFKRSTFILEVRDLWPEFAIDMGVLKNPILIKMSQWLEKFIYNRAKYIIINSPAYENYLISKGVDKNKILFIPNGVDVKMFNRTEKSQPLLEQYNLQGKFIVGYTGAMGMANKLETLLDAAKSIIEYKEIHFLLVGDGKEKRNLIAYTKKYNITNVTFADPVAKSKMPEVLSICDICTAVLMDIPMFSMVYPNKIFDYMAAGKAAIIAIDGVAREVIENANAGWFVDPGDPLALAERVKYAYQNQDILTRMGESAKSYVKEHFNREDQAQHLYEFLQKNVLTNQHINDMSMS